MVESATSWPVPASATVCGLPAALSVTVSVPARLLNVVGVKVTLMAQFEPAATGELVEHVVPLVATANSPLTARALISSGAVPEFVTVTDCGALVVPTSWPLNVRLAVESLIAACAPVPARLTVCGLVAALSLMVIAPVSAPPAVGVNVTLIVQLAAAARVAGASGQLLV